ncbi:hypothetical protein GUITHDRAFT_152574 [Guillardia theta CCMP2712]|uniref:Uncharacterized protein n=2 Tax=Guillardia theta TaxID=55529 RepID=L1JBB2_GUITC|nr:hypothetical protein GUITHDRAFT_152574 [Guillardia theta CCMP2712]EKX45818.1 hypothetical protein GUITHDRAFT_152574 [Guillardia theta CCMP2712]|eukprot:XP_005832798.1 hypothetical protein GUITHDRAFT_152574 [Guillardia theta CCMP2712]
MLRRVFASALPAARVAAARVKAPAIQTFPRIAHQRFFSSSFDVLLRQSDDVLNVVRKMDTTIMGLHWKNMDADDLEKIAEGIGRGRDLVNSLNDEEAQVAEREKKLVSTVEAAEHKLYAAIESDKLAAEAHDLRMLMEDLGTTGDGDNKPEAFQPAWEARIKSAFESYSDLLEKCDATIAAKVERECGYEMLLLKRVCHIDGFRYHHPRVHPSGFSATCD